MNRHDKSLKAIQLVLGQKEESMATEIIVMAAMAVTLLPITGVWADLYTYRSSR